MSHNYTPQVWVGCLACYNDGELVGRWMDADALEEFNASDGWQEQHAMLTARAVEDADVYGPHEEFQVFDWDDMPDVDLPESGTVEAAELLAWAGRLYTCADEVGMPAMVLAERIQDLDPGNPANVDPASVTSDSWCRADSLEEWAQDWVEDCGDDIPSYVVVDWEATARDLAMDYSVYRDAGEVWLFPNY